VLFVTPDAGKYFTNSTKSPEFDPVANVITVPEVSVNSTPGANFVPLMNTSTKPVV
jgi:hypothetical protein